jgi:hypothetical protein
VTSARRVALLLLVAVGLLLPEASRADVRRLEAVGASPVILGQGGALGLREKAIKQALREAVLRVARGLLLEAEASEDAALSLGDVLGTEMHDYTTRFRILDDQGERDALFSEDPEVATEYVVIVEVYVDVARVEARLLETEMIARPETSEERSQLLVEAYGLTQYPAYQAFRELLVTSAGARAALPLSFEHGRAVFVVDVETSLGPEGFLEWLKRLAPEGLGIRRVELSEGKLSVRVSWRPPDPEAEVSEESIAEDFEGTAIPDSRNFRTPRGASRQMPSPDSER